MNSPFDEKTVADLEAPLDPARVATMRGVKYLEGFDVIQRANEVFGYGAWGFEITKGPYVLEAGTRGQENRSYEVWACHLRLHIMDALPIEEMGTNVRSGDGPDGLEMAAKGAVTDALKRAFHHYGNQFGLSLYDKSPEAQRPTQQSRPQTQAQRGGMPATSPPVSPPAAATQQARSSPVERGTREATASGVPSAAGSTPAAPANVDTRTGEIVAKPAWYDEFVAWRRENNVKPEEIAALTGAFTVPNVEAWIAGGATRSIDSLKAAILSARRVPA